MSASTVVSYLRDIDFLAGRKVSTNQNKAPHFFSFLLRINPSLKLTPAKVLERSASWEGTHYLIQSINPRKLQTLVRKTKLY